MELHIPSTTIHRKTSWVLKTLKIGRISIRNEDTPLVLNVIYRFDICTIFTFPLTKLKYFCCFLIVWPVREDRKEICE